MFTLTYDFDSRNRYDQRSYLFALDIIRNDDSVQTVGAVFIVNDEAYDQPAKYVISNTKILYLIQSLCIILHWSVKCEDRLDF